MATGNTRGAAVFKGLSEGIERGLNTGIALRHMMTSEANDTRRTTAIEQLAKAKADRVPYEQVVAGVKDFIKEGGHLRNLDPTGGGEIGPYKTGQFDPAPGAAGIPAAAAAPAAAQPSAMSLGQGPAMYSDDEP